ncbi:MAG: DUF2911 domain-containing protein [Acidobacteriota bacterium]|jgi:hypothetical protein
MKTILLTTTVLLGTFALASAQQKKAPASPPAETAATIGGKAVSIKYNSPFVKGRKIFGGLVPYGQVWRAGANAATSLHTEAELTIGKLSVPKGDYTLFVLPEEKEWTLIVNKQTGQWGTEYSQANDLGRVKMTVKPSNGLIESFQITLTDKALTMQWENTVASVPVKGK